MGKNLLTIPLGWKNTKIDNLCQVFKGQGLSKDQIDANGTNKCLLYGELFTTYREIISAVKSKTSANEGVSSQEGDILMPGSTTTVARDLAVASALHENNVLLGGDINILRKKHGSQYDPDFLAYYLTHYKKQEISRVAQGTTIIHLYGSGIKDLEVTIPRNVEEQKKIAHILITVDQQIQKIDEIITATEKLKKGLMQQLFVRGIGHTKFKETKIGLIPDSWQLVILETVAKRGSGHTPNKKKPEYYNGGIKWVSLADTKLLDKGEIDHTKIEISQEGIENSSAVLHRVGTVLLSRDAGIGKSAVMAMDMAVSQHFIAWTCTDKLNNWYLYHYLQSQKRVFERIAIGSTIKTIGLEFFKKYQIPLPPIHEQNKIAGTLSAVDEKITVNQKLKAKWLLLKKGLAQDLLSGNKRTV